MACDVHVQVPGITAAYRCSIRRDELVAFRGQLVAAMETPRDVELVAMEQGVRLKLMVNDMGHILGEYEFRSDSDGPRLVGSFVADQTFLRPWFEEVNRVLACAENDPRR